MRKYEIINDVLRAIDDGTGAVLAIVVGTVGSAPRGAGAWMAVHADGRIDGTVGGGALERRAVEDARALLASGGSRLVRYTIGGARSDLGMVCGGSADLLLSRVVPSQRPALERMSEMAARRIAGACSIDLAPFGGPIPAGEHGDSRARVSGEAVRWEVATVDAGRLPAPGIDGDRYLEPICPEGRAFIFGCGHVGRALAEVLGFAGFEVVACDDRPEMLDELLLPRVAERVLVDYSDLGASVPVGAGDFAVVCTAGHASDFEVLAQMLPVRPRYVGCLGSTRKAEHTRARLREAGFAPDAIEAVDMPVGVPIACETPEEIAISIAARMVDVRRAG